MRVLKRTSSNRRRVGSAQEGESALPDGQAPARSARARFLRGTGKPDGQAPARSARARFLRGTGKPVAVLRILVSVTVVTGAWELAVRALGVSHIILPAPSLIFEDLVTILSSRLILEHMWTTYYEILVGFTLGASLAVVMGSGIAMSRLLEVIIYPYIIAINSIPKIAIAPLMVTWFGFGIRAKVVMAATLTFFPVLVNTIAGLRSAEAQQLELMRALDASRWQEFLRVRFPSSLPYVFAGLELGAVLSVVGAIVGEFVGANSGLGYLILRYNSQLRVGSAFAILVILAVTGIILHQMIVIARRRIVHWVEEYDEEQAVVGA